LVRYTAVEYLGHVCYTGVIPAGSSGARAAICTVHGVLYVSKPEDGRDKQACAQDALEVARAHGKDNAGKWHGRQ
jgi:hypothetical protein